MFAASKGHLGTVRYLIGKGAKVNAHSTPGISMPMIYGKTAATQTSESQGQLTRMNIFPILMSENGGLSPLHLACAGGYNLTVRELLAHGAEVNYHSPDGDTPLMYAAFKGYLPSVQSLVGRGADVNATDQHHTTALDLASWQGYLPVVRLLMAKGARINVRRQSGWSTVNFAQAGGNAAVIRVVKQAAERQARWEAAHPPNLTPQSEPEVRTPSPVPSRESINDGSIIIVR
jgi:ankyrin repeat protein